MALDIMRRVRLVLDRLSARRTEDDAKRAIGGIEGALSRLGRVARQIGGLIGAAFGVRALIRFGFDSVRIASESEKVWSKLRGTVSAAGEDFGALEGDLRGLGDAFQDVTTHDSEAFAGSLDRMISLTGDVSASLNNMGLVANVAAQFFGNDLAPAADLVAKVMNGNTMALKRMGIEVKDAQEGLNVLAQRSFGQATAATRTFSGRVAQLNNRWQDFKKELGFVLVGADGTTGALDVLTGAVRTMTKWVADNKDELRRWAKDGIDVAIAGMKTLIGLTRDFLRLQGKLSFTIGNEPFRPDDTREGIERQIKVLAGQRKQAEEEAAKALAALEKFQKGFFGTGLIPGGQLNPTLLKLNTDLQVANDLLDKIDENAKTAAQALIDLGKTPAKPNLFNPPQTGKNLKGEDGTKDGIKSAFEEMSKGQEVMKELADRLNQIGTLAKVLGPDFDAVGAEAEALQSAIEGLALAGDDVAEQFLPVLAERLNLVGSGLADMTENVMQAGPTLADAMDEIAAKAAVLGPEFDAAGAEVEVLTQRLIELAVMGLDESDPAFARYIARLRELKKVIGETSAAEKIRGVIAENAAQAITAAMFGELGDVGAAKAKQNTLQALEYYLLAAGDALFGGGLKVGPILALAAQHTALAAAWGALAAIGGGGGSSGGGGAGGGLSGARDASGPGSQKIDTSPEIHLHYVGPSIFNPKLQDAVFGMAQKSQRRRGNARIIEHPPGA